MKIVCLGDSLTEGDYGILGKRGIANVHSENYPRFLSNMLNAEVVNYGKCGFRASTFLKYYKDGNVNLDGADVIIIMLGTNGGHDDKEDTQDNRCYAELIDLCKKDAEGAEIVLCTPPHATENPEYSNCGYASQVEKAVLFVRKLAKEKGLPVIETALCPSFTAENEHIMQPNDGLHFGKEGYKTLAKFIAGELQKIIK